MGENMTKSLGRFYTLYIPDSDTFPYIPDSRQWNKYDNTWETIFECKQMPCRIISPFEWLHRNKG